MYINPFHNPYVSMTYVDLYYPGEIVEETTYFITPNPRQRYKSMPAYYELAEDNNNAFDCEYEEMNVADTEFGSMNPPEDAIDIISEVKDNEKLEPVLNTDDQDQEQEQEANAVRASQDSEESELELELSISATEVTAEESEGSEAGDQVGQEETVAEESEDTTTTQYPNAETTSAPYYNKLQDATTQTPQPQPMSYKMPPINFIEVQEPSITFIGLEQPMRDQPSYHRRSFYNYPNRPVPRMVPRDRFRVQHQQHQCHQPNQFPSGCDIGACGYDCGGYNPNLYR